MLLITVILSAQLCGLKLNKRVCEDCFDLWLLRNNAVDEVELRSEDDLFCNNCGKELVAGAKFCNTCGAPVAYVNNNINNNNVYDNSCGNGVYSNCDGNMVQSEPPVRQRITKTTVIVLVAVTVFVVVVAGCITSIIVGINANKLENKILGSWVVDDWWLGTKYEFYENGEGYYTGPNGSNRTRFTWNIDDVDKLTIRLNGESNCVEYYYGTSGGDSWEFKDLDGSENDVLQIGYDTLYR